MAEFEGAAAFREALLAAVDTGVNGGARRLVMVDADFDAWPLDDSALLDNLVSFARAPGRRLHLLANSYEGIRRRSPRFTQWRTTWGHTVDARLPEDPALALPSGLLVDRHLAVVLRDRAAWIGELTQHAPQVHAISDAIDALLQRGSPGFAQRVLGL
jgi:hypothetical protein